MHWQEAGGATEAGKVDATGAGDQLPMLSPVHHALYYNFSGTTWDPAGEWDDDCRLKFEEDQWCFDIDMHRSQCTKNMQACRHEHPWGLEDEVPGGSRDFWSR